MDVVCSLPRCFSAILCMLTLQEEIGISRTCRYLRMQLKAHRSHRIVCSISWSAGVGDVDATSKTDIQFQWPFQYINDGRISDTFAISNLYMKYINRYIQWGVFSMQVLPRDTVIGAYEGELIRSGEAARRAEVNTNRGYPNYILTVREHVWYEDKPNIVLKTNIDATYLGNVSRYINHSCDPNLEMCMMRCEGDILGKPVLKTVRVIYPDEQLTFNYGIPDRLDEIGCTDDIHGDVFVGHMPKRRRTGLRQLTRCLCGSSNCDGYLPNDYTPF